MWGRGSLASGAGGEEGLAGPHVETSMGRVRVGVASGARPWLSQHTTHPGPRGVLGIFWKLPPHGGWAPPAWIVPWAAEGC